MKVLITGATGQVGRALLASVPSAVHPLGLARQQLDIGDAEAVHATVQAERPELIVNAAAYTAVDRAESERELAWRINADGPRHLAMAAQEFGARLVHLSTDFVFDGQASVPYATSAATHPLSAYGGSKRDGENGVLGTLGPRAVVLRTAWVYAAVGSNFVRTMLRLMSTRGEVRVVADQIGSPTAARSVAEAIWALAAKPALHGIFHWTDVGVASWYDLAVAIEEEARARALLTRAVSVEPIASAEYPTAARRPGYSVLETGTTRAALGIAPKHWRVNLRRVIAEIQNV